MIPQSPVPPDLLEQAHLALLRGDLGQTGSIWTRPMPDPVSPLLQSPKTRKWPKPLLLVVCLLVGMLSVLLPGLRHHHRYHSSWGEDIAFGLVGGVALFVWMVVRKR